MFHAVAATALGVASGEKLVVAKDELKLCVESVGSGAQTREVSLSVEDPQAPQVWEHGHPNAVAAPDVAPAVFTEDGGTTIVVLLPGSTLTLRGALDRTHAVMALRTMLGF